MSITPLLNMEARGGAVQYTPAGRGLCDRTHHLVNMDRKEPSGPDIGPAPTATAVPSSPVEGTRPLNSDFTIPREVDTVNSGRTQGMETQSMMFPTDSRRPRRRSTENTGTMPSICSPGPPAPPHWWTDTSQDMPKATCSSTRKRQWMRPHQISQEKCWTMKSCSAI